MSGQRPESGSSIPHPSGVLRLVQTNPELLSALLSRFGMELVLLEADASIAGSYWGDEEAGLVGTRVMARSDTPVHSIFHEACHYICMSPDRRRQLDTDAGGGYEEENAVCYLQILLTDHVAGCSRHRMMSDMDAWGYSFRLGSAQAWFKRDAADALAWLQEKGLVDRDARVTWQLRGE